MRGRKGCGRKSRQGDKSERRSRRRDKSGRAGEGRIWRAKGRLLAAGTLSLAVTAAAWGACGGQAVETAGEASGTKRPIYSVETDEQKAALTFDCAWGSEDLAAILGTLAQCGVRATFFVTGDFVENYPEEVRRISQAGHDLGNHGDAHLHMAGLDGEQCREEIEGAHTKVKNVTGKEMELFRPPYGDYSSTLVETAEELGYYTVQWDVDSLDWKDYGAADIVERTAGHEKLKNGSIILLHTGTRYTAQALHALIERLEEAGYELVPVSQLILREDYTVDFEGRQRAIPKEG